ncbi:MAG: alkene reductase [Gammaproteobacteria bacterium]|jgi:N-ethylmaleimide reductase
MKLFEPLQLGNMHLNNRIVMAPLTRSRADAKTNAPGELAATYYGQRASAGLIIAEGTSPSPNGVGYPRIPGIYSQAQIDGWSRVAEAVHAAGGNLFVQLMHCGRVAHEANLPQGAEVIAPSAVELPGEMYTDAYGLQPHTPARAMTLEDIHRTAAEYVQAARNAVEAGCDGVEIHAANGYLLEQFIHPHTNRRDDDYGGSIEKRCRYVLEVVQQCCDAIGRERVGIRLSPHGTFNDMPVYDAIDETYLYLAKELEKIGLLYIHLADMSGMGGPAIPRALKETMSNSFGGDVILCGDYDKARAEEDLELEIADLIAFGRPFISNPDFVERLRNDWPLAAPDMETFYTPGEKGYSDYPVYTPA